MMSMIARYKKQDGFHQLLTLIETSSPHKREELLAIIQSEDPSWAALLKTKILTLEKVFSWNAAFLARLMNQIPSQTLAAVLSTRDALVVDKILSTLNLDRQEEVRSLMNENVFSPGEAEVSRVKILTTIRELDHEKKINLGEADPVLSLRDLRIA